MCDFYTLSKFDYRMHIEQLLPVQATWIGKWAIFLPILYRTHLILFCSWKPFERENNTERLNETARAGHTHGQFLRPSKLSNTLCWLPLKVVNLLEQPYTVSPKAWSRLSSLRVLLWEPWVVTVARGRDHPGWIIFLFLGASFSSFRSGTASTIVTRRFCSEV